MTQKGSYEKLVYFMQHRKMLFVLCVFVERGNISQSEGIYTVSQKNAPTLKRYSSKLH